MLLERTYTAADIKAYREETGASMWDAKKHFEDQHQLKQKALLNTMIKHAEENKDISLIIGALKILAERY
jgi:translation elongation factor EF-Ts